MGQSTNAVLFWGYCSADEGKLVSDGWVEELAVSRGHVNPWSAFPVEIDQMPDYTKRRAASDAWTTANRQALDEWYAVRKAIEQEHPIDADFHCSCDCPMPYLAVKESVHTAHRGYPIELVPSDLDVKPEWYEQLEAFCKLLKIEKPHPEPKWWLVSHWC